VDPLGQHALSCHNNSGTVQRHAWLNDLIYHAFMTAEVPAVKEPQRLRDDVKRPDDLPLKPGRSGTWDMAVVHTLAASYISPSAAQTAY